MATAQPQGKAEATEAVKAQQLSDSNSPNAKDAANPTSRSLIFKKQEANQISRVFSWMKSHADITDPEELDQGDNAPTVHEMACLVRDMAQVMAAGRMGRETTINAVTYLRLNENIHPKRALGQAIKDRRHKNQQRQSSGKIAEYNATKASETTVSSINNHIHDEAGSRSASSSTTLTVASTADEQDDKAKKLDDKSTESPHANNKKEKTEKPEKASNTPVTTPKPEDKHHHTPKELTKKIEEKNEAVYGQQNDAKPTAETALTDSPSPEAKTISGPKKRNSRRSRTKSNRHSSGKQHGKETDKAKDAVDAAKEKPKHVNHEGNPADTAASK